MDDVRGRHTVADVASASATSSHRVADTLLEVSARDAEAHPAEDEATVHSHTLLSGALSLGLSCECSVHAGKTWLVDAVSVDAISADTGWNAISSFGSLASAACTADSGLAGLYMCLKWIGDRWHTGSHWIAQFFVSD